MIFSGFAMQFTYTQEEPAAAPQDQLRKASRRFRLGALHTTALL